MGGEGHGPRQLSATEVAALTGGRLLGPDGVRITAIAPLERARPDELSFVATAKYKDALAQSRAGLVLCTAEFADAPGPPTRVVVAQPHEALLALLPVLYPEAAWMPGIHPTAVIGRGATWSDPVAIGPYVVLGQDVRLGKNVRIGAGCTLGDGVVVGDDVQLFPQVTCYSGTVLGDRVIAHAGARLGSDGFGYIPGGQGRAHRKIPQVGRCLIGDDVEIGANTTVDRGSVDDTVVGAGTKIDNLVQIAHNVHVGERCLIAAMAGIAGSTHVGDEVFLGGQVGIADHVTIGSGVRVTVQGGVIGNLPDGAMVTGMPARDHKEFMRAQAALYRLAKIVRELETLVHEAHGAEH